MTTTTVTKTTSTVTTTNKIVQDLKARVAQLANLINKGDQASVLIHKITIIQASFVLVSKRLASCSICF